MPLVTGLKLLQVNDTTNSRSAMPPLPLSYIQMASRDMNKELREQLGISSSLHSKSPRTKRNEMLGDLVPTPYPPGEDHVKALEKLRRKATGKKYRTKKFRQKQRKRYNKKNKRNFNKRKSRKYKR